MPLDKRINYHLLKDKWKRSERDLHETLLQKHGSALEWINNASKQFVVGSLGGLMLLSSSVMPKFPSFKTPSVEMASAKELGKNVFLIYDLSKALPKEVRVLTNSEEQEISQILSRDFNLKVSAELAGKRLNRSYGLIGAEQHLARFPGDNIDNHFDTQDEARQFSASGMAPGLGAWGYFSSGQLTETDKQREKYYIAVQTFLVPDYYQKTAEYVAFFRYRKMLVVNPQNGKAVVAVIGDSGPAEWTGKHLGGSPEVMNYLERSDGSARGPVLYFFIDDPQDKVPLGPIGIQ